MTCRELGVATYAFDDAGNAVSNQVGEIVMTQPIPCMPLHFWVDGGTRYFESYFDVYPGVWRHGDWLELIPRAATVYGRSDATINRHGIRMGTSEIYRVADELPEILDSLVVDLEYLRPGIVHGTVRRAARCDGCSRCRSSRARCRSGRRESGHDRHRNRVARTRARAIRTLLLARHVPNGVFAIPEVPRTLSGKKLEVPVRKILLGQPAAQAVNRASMANPASMDWFSAFARGCSR